MKYNPQIVAKTFKTCGLPKPVFEFRFHPVRRWRFDIAWPDKKVYLEVQGGLFTGGRHTRGAQLLKEYEKINHASADGWRGLFVQPCDLLMSDTIEMIRATLQYKPIEYKV